MKENEKKEVKKSLIIIFAFICCLGGIIWFYIYDYNQLKEEALYTKGVITETFAVAKGGNFVRFEFYLNNIKYISSDGYSIRDDQFDIGDSCFVRYARTNPQNCRLVTIFIGGNKVIKIQKSKFPKDSAIIHPPNPKSW
jgi:hypothetical protein